MNKNQLKNAVNDIHIRDDMQRRLMDNCTQSRQVRNTAYRAMKRRLTMITTSITILVLGFTGVVYGQAIYENIKKVILGGHAQYIDADYSDFANNSSIDMNDIKIPPDKSIFTNPAEAQLHLAFNLKLPTYLPEGYQFDRIELYNDYDGKISGDYANVYFTKGEKFIYLQARLMSEETGFATSLGKLKEIEINGYKGLKGWKNLDVDINGVMYMFSVTTADVDSDELVKMIEAIY